MQSARETETNVYYHYTEFGRRAQQEGYRGIAYLFTAFAASEQVHATNFGKILTRLNVELVPLPKPAVRAGSTRENLIRAADSEISSIETFYPKLLEQLKPEGHEESDHAGPLRVVVRAAAPRQDPADSSAGRARSSRLSRGR